MGQNGQKVEFWAVNSLQLGLSSSKSAHLGCYSYLDIMNLALLKTARLFVALRIFLHMPIARHMILHKCRRYCGGGICTLHEFEKKQTNKLR